jgi:hypothetical protein
MGVGVIVVEPTADLLKLQKKLIDAVAPFTVKTGTSAAFFTTADDPDINPTTIDYVATFIPTQTGSHFHPHVTLGIASQDYLKRNDRRALCCIRVFASGAVCLPTRPLRDGSEETQGMEIEALKSLSGEAQLMIRKLIRIGKPFVRPLH